jgi:hypothetical protein
VVPGWTRDIDAGHGSTRGDLMKVVIDQKEAFGHIERVNQDLGRLCTLVSEIDVYQGKASLRLYGAGERVKELRPDELYDPKALMLDIFRQLALLQELVNIGSLAQHELIKILREQNTIPKPVLVMEARR